MRLTPWCSKQEARSKCALPLALGITILHRAHPDRPLFCCILVRSPSHVSKHTTYCNRDAPVMCCGQVGGKSLALACKRAHTFVPLPLLLICQAAKSGHRCGALGCVTKPRRELVCFQGAEGELEESRRVFVCTVSFS